MSYFAAEHIAIERLEEKQEELDKKLSLKEIYATDRVGKSANVESAEKQEKKPAKFTYRAVALKDFKPGEIMLAPCSLINPQDLLLTRAGANKLFSDEKDQQEQKFQRHIKVAVVKVRCDPEKKAPAAKGEPKPKQLKANFFMTSPLQKKTPDHEEDLGKMSALWAVGKTTKSSAVNMSMENKVFRVPPIIPVGTTVQEWHGSKTARSWDMLFKMLGTNPLLRHALQHSWDIAALGTCPSKFL